MSGANNLLLHEIYSGANVQLNVNNIKGASDGETQFMLMLKRIRRRDVHILDNYDSSELVENKLWDAYDGRRVTTIRTEESILLLRSAISCSTEIVFLG